MTKADPSSVFACKWDMEIAQAQQELDDISRAQAVSSILALMVHHQITVDEITADQAVRPDARTPRAPWRSYDPHFDHA